MTRTCNHHMLADIISVYFHHHHHHHCYPCCCCCCCFTVVVFVVVCQKRLSAITLSLAGTISTPTEFEGSGSVPPSPLRRDFTSEPPRHAQPMNAIRKLTFQFPPAAVESGVGKDNEEEGITASAMRKVCGRESRVSQLLSLL